MVTQYSTYKNNPSKIDTVTNLLICSSISNMLYKPVLAKILDGLQQFSDNDPYPITVDNTLTIDHIRNGTQIVDLNLPFGSPEVEEILGDRKYDKIMFTFCPYFLYTNRDKQLLADHMTEIWYFVDKHLLPMGIVSTMDMTVDLANYLSSTYNIVYESQFEVYRSDFDEMMPIYVFRKIPQI